MSSRTGPLCLCPRSSRSADWTLNLTQRSCQACVDWRGGVTMRVYLPPSFPPSRSPSTWLTSSAIIPREKQEEPCYMLHATYRWWDSEYRSVERKTFDRDHDNRGDLVHMPHNATKSRLIDGIECVGSQGSTLSATVPSPSSPPSSMSKRNDTARSCPGS